jgi:hypothetical protein
VKASVPAVMPWMLAVDLVAMVVVAAALSWRIAVGNPNRSRLPDVVATSSWQAAGREAR